MPVFTKENKKILFIHIPKTGGTYIEDLFRANGYQVNFWKPRRLRPAEAISPQHYHYDLLKQIFDMDAFDFCFSVIRHPQNRLISEYKMQNPAAEHAFAPWCQNILEKAAKNLAVDDNHIRPQCDFLYQGLRIYRQESGFDDSFIHSLEQHGNIQLEIKSVQRRRDNRQWRRENAEALTLPPSLQAQINDFYQQDYQKLGYSLPQ